MNDDSPNAKKLCWPGLPAALRRFGIILVVLFPLTWAVNSLLIGSWRVSFGGAESKRHFVEWMVVLAGTAGVILLLSLMPSFRRVLSRRNARRLLFTLACFFTVLALFHAVENWRGWRAWNRYRHELEEIGRAHV